MKPVATTALPRVAIIVLTLIVLAQGVVVVTLWQRLGDAQAEHAAREQARLETARRAEAERTTLLARLRTAESRLAELAPPTKPADAPPTGSILLERTLGSQVAFSYGTPREAGRYVGQTLQRLFAARRSQTPEEVEQMLKDNELNILSMGPFIKDAELLEADPSVFATFQAEVLGEVFALDEARRERYREILLGARAAVRDVPAGSEPWIAADERAAAQLIALLTGDERTARQPEIEFLSTHGVLLVPTYSLLTK